MPIDPKRDRNQDAAVAGTFPASDPLAGTPESGTRAVPPQDMMGHDTPMPPDAVTLRRRFPSAESAKLALEALVREGPVDRNAAEIVAQGEETELRIAAPANDLQRLRDLLAKAS
ncbi:hypothetical protein [Falsiroseomonas oryziterrae]|uniref:hypothetical protein n=1 Tax=Falsiroseomonas oryziterrae TaxID=2911368 RepID=UPI001F1CA419|nr:hypothetical protein [Roseomonas sp. NPKOSM-4]